jgi:Tol biopolymer transport system component
MWILSGSALQAQWTQRASVDGMGVQGDLGSAYPALSADGRFVAFESLAANLVAGDTNGHYDVFVRDLWSGTIERVSADSAGTQGNGDSTLAGISADGRFVTFQSRASNLVAGDTNIWQDVFVRDRLNATTERVSLSSLGTQANKDSWAGSVSADGRYVAFMSQASNLVTPDFVSTLDCFVRDRLSGSTRRVSDVYSGGGPGNLHSYWPVISADGRFVAFHSAASNIVANDFNGTVDVFVYEMASGINTLVSRSSAGLQGDFASSFPSISADGRFVAFHSIATNLVPGDSNMLQDVYVRDLVGGTTERISLGAGGVQPDADCGWAIVSADGNWVSFESAATNLVAGDSNGLVDIFLADHARATIERVDLDNAGAQANGGCSGSNLSADGRWVAFGSSATNLVSADSNGVDDVFVRDRDATGFSSLCDAGSGGVLPCPCANPPAGPGQGCDNSAATGGAILSASGPAYLAQDQLAFRAIGETPTATSILLQGDAQLAGGSVFGQGLRCVGGSLKRLYVRGAVAGSLSVPDPALGDPSVSSRSAALGDPIQAGQSRWYLMYYRDPTVLGGCSALSTFNSTQTGEVRWSP